MQSLPAPLSCCRNMGKPYHLAILAEEIPLSIGGGILQSQTMTLLLRKAHLGEVSASVCRSCSCPTRSRFLRIRSSR